MHREKRSGIFFEDLGALVVCLVGLFLWSFILSLKFEVFGYYDWDLALYSQVMQSLCHGTTYASLFQTSFLADHAHYIAFLLTPIYAVFPSPLTLIYLELLAFFGGAFVFYKIITKSLGRAAALILMGVYILHPANVFMLFYEFHFESLAIFFFFLMFYFWDKRKWVAFIITAIITMLIKENMALVIVMFGVFGLISSHENKWRWGGSIIIFGLIFFLVNVFVLIPWMRKDLTSTGSIYWSCYQQFGATPSNIFYYLISHPFVILKGLCIPPNLSYFIQCVNPFAFLSVFSPQFLIGCPILAENLLSRTSNMHSIYYHYAATFIPFVAMGAADMLSFIKTRSQLAFRIFIALMVIFSIMNTCLYWNVWQKKVWDYTSYPEGEIMVKQIPKGASVVASFMFLNHLTDHREIYAFYNVWKDVNYFTNQRPFKFPADIQYALIDFNDPWLLYDINHGSEVKNHINSFFLKYKWKVKQRMGMVYLFERGDKNFKVRF